MDDQFTGPVAPQPSVTSSQQPIPPTASKTSHKKKIIIFVVIALILIVAAAFGAYQFEHSRAVKAENRQQSQIDSLKKQINSSQKPVAGTKSTGSTTPTNPYSGWKSFCSSQGGLCLKYPASWSYKQQTINTGGSGGPETNTITSPSGKVIVVYKPNWQISGPGGNGVTFRVTKVTSNESSGLEAVQLLFDCLTVQASTPYTSCPAEEFVLPISASYRLSDKNVDYAQGKTVTGYGNGQFYSPHATGQAARNIQRLFVTNDAKQFGQPGFPTSADAQTWLNSPDVSTAYRILESVYYK